MKQSNYMSSNALIEFLKIGILSSELDKTIIKIDRFYPSSQSCSKKAVARRT